MVRIEMADDLDLRFKIPRILPETQPEIQKVHRIKKIGFLLRSDSFFRIPIFE